MLTEPSSKGQGAGDGLTTQPHLKKRRRRRRGGEEEKPVLRTTCDNCTSAKVKCNGEKRCVRCKNKNIQCEYTFKKRCGPKRRKGLDAARGVGGNEGLLSPYATGNRVLGFDDHLRGMATALNKDDVECVDVFMQNLNTFLPLTTFETFKRAATQAPHEGGDGEEESSGATEDEERSQLHHARKAVLHGAIAVGAEFLDRDEASVTHAGIARQEIKECFDAAVPELVGAYLILALYWTQQMDSSKIARYMGLAHQSSGIICDPPEELVASLTFVSVVLFDAKVVQGIGCRVDPPGPAEKPDNPALSTPAAVQARVLKILSFVVLAIHNRSSPSVEPATSTGDWNAEALAGHVEEASALLGKGATGSPNDVSRCVVVILQAYFLLLAGDRRQAVVITEQLSDLVGDNPLVLHLPIVWSMMRCVRVLLEDAGRTIVVERLQLAMEPLATRLEISTEESMVEREMMAVFANKQRVTRGERAVPAPLQRRNILARQKAQTSSLNVTAQDYSQRSRPSIGSLDVEPSAAPRRRPLTASTTGQHPPGGPGRADISSLSTSSSMSGGVPSSSASVMASSPPLSRAGALSRTPAARGSLSTPHPFERAPASLLQLDIPYAPDFADTVQIPPSDMVLPGIVPHFRSANSPSPTVKEEEVEVEVGMTGSGRGGVIGGGGGEMQLDDSNVGADRLELMTRQQVQQSFKADAPVSLEQVESNMARLGVSHVSEGEAALNRLVTSMDLDAAAELLATKTSFIS